MKKEMQINQKLRVVTRRDLTPEQQAVQAAHAAIDYQHQFPTEAKEWQTKSNYLALLTVSNEEALEHLTTKATIKGINFTIFREPDLDNSVTAVAFEPSEDSRRLLASLPLLNFSNQNQLQEHEN